ncbi:MAG: HAMP domain-containing sensor histidine kinase [Clostridiaceae bacterium]
MIKKISSKKIYEISVVITLILFALFTVAVFHITSILAERLLLLSLFIFLVIVGMVIMYEVHKKIADFSDELDRCLDDMINGREDIDFLLNEETLISKLQIKLKRLYEIMLQQSRKSITEKEAIQCLVSDISHQVKTPIANIKMYNGILQDRQLTEEKRRDFFIAISTQVDKLDFLMQSMVKMSRLETGIFEIKPKQALIYNTLAQALSGIEPKAETKKINITVECAETIIALFDEKWTTEALFNILDNAIKYTPRGGEVVVSVNQWEFYTKIDILDTGKGIPEKSYGSIFKRFYREPEVHNQEGVGIGLYLSREIITMQNGYIEVKSRLGIGTTFSVFIPN